MTKQSLSAWKDFQDEIRAHFASIGAEAQTNCSLKGVRTRHAIDVLVKTKFLGQNLTWIVEAKRWKTRVSKLHVAALRTILADLGADRGFIISELGFQKGAREAAHNTNVYLMTFAELKQATRELVESEILRAYRKRTDLLAARYWSHAKEIRIKYDLRGRQGLPLTFSGIILLIAVRDAISSAEKKEYPIDFLTADMEKTAGEASACNFQQLTNWLNVNLNLLDEELLLAEAKMQEAGDFQPDLRPELIMHRMHYPEAPYPWL